MARVLITGVAGFIGSNLAERLLSKGHSVIGIDNLSFGLRDQVAEGVEFHEKDIRSKDIHHLFRDVEFVFHLAAKNSLLDCQEDPVATMDNNVTGTANVFDAVRREGKNIRRVMYAESSAVEEGDDRLVGFYAISKLVDAWIAKGYRAAYGINSVGLRYYNVYGPRQDYRRTAPPIMSKLIITLLKGGTPILFEGDEENKRDFIHVDDINDFHELCLTDDRVANRVFRLGSGKNFSIKEVLEKTQEVLGTNKEATSRPRPAGDPVVATLADISEASLLGWQPKIELKEGIQSMVPYIKAEIEKGNI